MTNQARVPRIDGARALNRLFAVLTVGAAVAGFPAFALAQHGGGEFHGDARHNTAGGWHGGSGGWHGGSGGWHGSAHDWHGGHWYHGRYGNQFGWWWNVPGYDWYSYYDAPTYPSPAYPYAGAPPPNVWYYCQNPAGYYPYVQQCAGPWQPVQPPGG